MSNIPLRHDEQIVAEIRRFGFTYIWRWIGALIPFAIAGLYMFWFFDQGTWGMIGFVTFLIIGAAGCISNYVRHKGTVLILTNYRIVDIAKDGIFGRTVSEAELTDVEDIVVRQRGIWRMMFNYGTVEIRLKESKVRIDVEYVRRPIGVQRLINELKKQQSIEGGVESEPTLHDIHKSITELNYDDLLYLKKVIEIRLKKLRE